MRSLCARALNHALPLLSKLADIRPQAAAGEASTFPETTGTVVEHNGKAILSKFEQDGETIKSPFPSLHIQSRSPPQISSSASS